MASVQDVQPLLVDGKLHYAFAVWDDANRLVANVAFASHDEAQAAAQQVKEILDRATLVLGRY
jgi:hypothetical protein